MHVLELRQSLTIVSIYYNFVLKKSSFNGNGYYINVKSRADDGKLNKYISRDNIKLISEIYTIF